MRFFFYGTLMTGSHNSVADALHARLHALGPAVARGRLYAIPDPLGWYPALLPGEGTVQGALYEATPDFDATDLARIDAYEDFDPTMPASSLYLRQSIPIEGKEGAHGTVQAYLFNQPLTEGAQPIAGGDFRAWLAQNGLDAFRGLRED